MRYISEGGFGIGISQGFGLAKSLHKNTILPFFSSARGSCCHKELQLFATQDSGELTEQRFWRGKQSWCPEYVLLPQIALCAELDLVFSSVSNWLLHYYSGLTRGLPPSIVAVLPDDLPTDAINIPGTWQSNWLKKHGIFSLNYKRLLSVSRSVIAGQAILLTAFLLKKVCGRHSR